MSTGSLRLTACLRAMQWPMVLKLLAVVEDVPLVVARTRRFRAQTAGLSPVSHPFSIQFGSEEAGREANRLRYSCKACISACELGRSFVTAVPLLDGVSLMALKCVGNEVIKP